MDSYGAVVIPITQADEDLYRSVTVAARLARAQPILDHLNSRYSEEWDDAGSGFPVALANLAVFRVVGGQMVNHTSYHEITETLNDVLYGQPDHWLSRYLVAWFRSLVAPNPFVDDEFIEQEQATAAQTVKELISRQESAPWQPWFACTYVLAGGLVTNGPDDIELAAGAIRQAAARTTQRIPFTSLGGLLANAFHTYCAKPELPERATVAQMAQTLFGAALTIVD